MSWHLARNENAGLEDALSDRLVAHNLAASPAMRLRFDGDNLRVRPVQAYAVTEAGHLVGGCVGSTVDVWQWLTVDVMWVDPSRRAQGIGRALLLDVEERALQRGCRWARLNTWEFQAPDFYERLGYSVYGREVDYPPGHVNHLMRKDL